MGLTGPPSYSDDENFKTHGKYLEYQAHCSANSVSYDSHLFGKFIFGG
jgi:hypothetical protein